MLDNIILEIIGTIIQNITYLGTMLYFAGLHPKKLLSLRFFICFAIYSFIVYPIQMHDDSWALAAIFIIMFLYTAIIKFNAKCSFSFSLIAAAFGYMFVTIIEIICLCILNLFHLKVHFSHIDNLVTVFFLILTMITTILVCYFFNIDKIFNKIRNLSYSIAITLITIALIITSIIEILGTYDTGLVFPTLSTFIIFFLIGIIISLEAIKDYRRKQELMSYNKYLPIVHQMILNIQKRQHLYNNQIQSLVGLAKNRDVDSIIDAINKLSNISISDDNAYNFLHLENQLLAGLLFCKFQNSVEQQKNMVFNILDYKYHSKCNDFEIIDIVGILLDNALEATYENDTIYVTIGHSSLETASASNENMNAFTIKVENPGPVITSELTHSIFTTHYTTKAQPDGHGLGLSILKSTVEKYHGTITLSNTFPDGADVPYFCIEISI